MSSLCDDLHVLCLLSMMEVAINLPFFLHYFLVAVIGFNQSTYVLHEQSNQDSFVDVCVELISGTIALGVSINYVLDYDTTGITQGQFHINSVY